MAKGRGFLITAFIALLMGSHAAQAMEAAENLVGKAATEALGEGAASLEKGALENLTKEVAAKMEVEIQDIAALPEETRKAFQNRLVEAFKTFTQSGGDLRALEQDKIQAFSSALNDAKTAFRDQDLAQIGQERGFSSLEKNALSKFGAGVDFLEKFPLKSEGEAGQITENMSKEEKGLIETKNQLAESKRNLEYVKNTDPTNESRIDGLQKQVERFKEDVGKAEEALGAEKKAATEKAELEAKKAQEEVIKAEKTGDSAAVQSAVNKATQAQNELTVKKMDQEITERQSADGKLTRARESRLGTAEQQKEIKVKQKALDEAKAEERKAQKSGNTAKKEETRKIRTEAEKELKDAKAKAGTKGKFEAAKEKLDELKRTKASNKEISAAENELKSAQNEDNLAQEEIEAARKEWLEKASILDVRALPERLKRTFVEHVLNSFVGGFVFSFPNMIIEAIQGAFNRTAVNHQLNTPQRFGGVWMQIPTSLINEYAPSASKYLYVGIEKKSNDTVNSRVNEADTDSYFSLGNFYFSINDYDEYGAAAISDPNFPNAMVHLNTGYHFSSDGLPYDPANPVVPLLQAGQRAKSIQMHLDDQAGEILRGVSGEVYTELRVEKTGYKGNATIANRFNQSNNKNIPFDVGPPNAYGQILDYAVKLGAVQFGPFSLAPISALTAAQMTKISTESKFKAPINKPYVALGQYVYQSDDTPQLKLVKKNAADGQAASLAKDYLVAFDRDYRVIALHTPLTVSSEYGFASYALNPSVMYVGSLVSDAVYDKSGKELKNLIIDMSKIMQQQLSSLDPDLQGQIALMRAYVTKELASVQESLKYGPITIGASTLTIDKKIFDQGIYVYKIDKALEDGSPDYVVAMALDSNKRAVVSSLPNNNVFAFISLISSRFYDGSLVAYDKPHAGKKDTSYTVYKQISGAFLLTTGAADAKYGKELFSGFAPLYSIFMDPEINPNRPTQAQQKILVQEGAQSAESKVLPVPLAWALSDRGPMVNYESSMRIGQVLAKSLPEFKAKLDTLHESWKNFMMKLDPSAAERAYGSYRFTTDLLRNIIIKPTSLDAIQNGNYVYISDYYPNEYLVLSNDENGTDSLATEYDLAKPQRYAISLSNGKVYDAQAQGAEVKVLTNLDELLKRAQSEKTFQQSLLKKIVDSQQAYQSQIGSEQYGSHTQFGPFAFFIDEDDLKAGRYVYADVSNIKNPLAMDRKQLYNQITDYFICIESPAQTNDTAQWIYGTKLGPKTYRVVSLVTGALYDRGGTYQSSYAAYALSVSNNLDINKGFLQVIYNLAKTTWATELSAEMRERILALTSKQYEKLMAEREEISQAQEKESKLYEPMDPNLKANIDTQPYDELAKNMVPPRYIKQYKGKYYAVPAPDQEKLKSAPVYIDYNVGSAGKDNNAGMSYDEQGKPIMRFQGWFLEVMRAYAGITVAPDGKQEIGIGLDHPSIPVDALVLLDKNKIAKKRTAARDTFKKAAEDFAKSKDNSAPILKQKMLDASIALGNAEQEYISCKALERAKIISSKEVKYEFLFNEKLGIYFVHLQTDKDNFYIDLAAGYVYNLDGTPRLDRKTLFAGTKKDDGILLVGHDTTGLLFATYKGQDGAYYSWKYIEDVVIAGQGRKAYKMRSADSEEVNFLAYDSAQEEYIVFPSTADESVDVNATPIVFNKKNNLFFSNIFYARTRSKGDPQGAYISDDNPSDLVGIIWDGKPSLVLQSIFYNQNFIPLKRTGPNLYTGSYMQKGKNKTISVTQQSTQITSDLQARWISILEDNVNYDYIYQIQVLDTTSPLSCPSDIDYVYNKDTLELKLNYWKECAWQINAVNDAFGVSSIVNKVEVNNLLSVDISAVQGVPDRKEVRAALENQIDQISYDKNAMRYVYMISAADTAMPYYQPQRTGWYIDLAKGILFDLKGYPVGSILASHLYLLLDKLGVSVVQVADPNGEQQYDNQGNIVMNPATKKPLKTKPGLGYRSIKQVKSESVQLDSQIKKKK